LRRVTNRSGFAALGAVAPSGVQRPHAARRHLFNILRNKSFIISDSTHLLKFPSVLILESTPYSFSVILFLFFSLTIVLSPLIFYPLAHNIPVIPLFCPLTPATNASGSVARCTAAGKPRRAIASWSLRSIRPSLETFFHSLIEIGLLLKRFSIGRRPHRRCWEPTGIQRSCVGSQ
jgi:hypothetical protein